MQSIVSPIPIKEFRDNLSTYFGKAVYGREAVVVRKYRDEGVFISREDYDEYQRLLNPRLRMTQEEWNDHFVILDKIRAQIPQFPPDEVEQDIAEALAEVRTQSREP